MKELITSWLQDQIEECPEDWDFPTDFDQERAIAHLRAHFDYSHVTDHLEHLLIEYLR